MDGFSRRRKILAVFLNTATVLVGIACVGCVWLTMAGYL